MLVFGRRESEEQLVTEAGRLRALAIDIERILQGVEPQAMAGEEPAPVLDRWFLEVHIFDRATTGPKPKLAKALGATYHVGDFGGLRPDVVIECTGAGQVVLEAVRAAAIGGIACLAGISSGGHRFSLDIAAMNRKNMRAA